MSWNPYRIVRSVLRDPDFFQAVAYGFVFAVGVVMLAVGPIILRG